MAYNSQNEHRLVIALDYGTTFTGVAFATPYGTTCNLNEIEVMSDWGSQMGNHMKVPSVISYSQPTAAREQQWGSSLSPTAVAMVHTKLELDPSSLSNEMDLLLQSLDGMKNLNFSKIRDTVGPNGVPEYTHKKTEEIVLDYLTKVFQYLEREVEKLSEAVRTTISTDIVVTIPTGWSYAAMNSTYRAVTQAGFNRFTFPRLSEVIFVTESEAAAVYTARHLESQLKDKFLKLNESFVLCDAGGGTVDVVSYTVKQLEPSLILEQIGKPTGRKCGSIFINMAFKRWLRKLIGENYYRQLDPNMEGHKISSHSVEGNSMRELMKRFDAIKEGFTANYGRDIRLDLPPPLQDLKSKHAKMEDFFDQCVTQIVELIRQHQDVIEQIGTGIRTKNIFLVGGFGESLYLQEQIRQHLNCGGLNLRVPDTSWTAVVRGAVICSIEKLSSQNLIRASQNLYDYGISVDSEYNQVHHSSRDAFIDTRSGKKMAKGQFQWLLNSGDLLPSNAPVVVRHDISLDFSETEKKEKDILIYRYFGNDRPTKLLGAHNEVEEVRRLHIDVSHVPLPEFVLLRKRPDAYSLAVQLVLALDKNGLKASVWKGRQKLVGEHDTPERDA